MLLPTCFTMTNSVIYKSNRSSVIMEICQKIPTPRTLPFKVTRESRSLEPTQINRPPVNSYIPYIHTYHSMYGTISYRFPDKGRYLQNFPTPLCLTPPLRGFPWNFVSEQGLKNLKRCPYQKVKNMWRYVHSSQYPHWTDRTGKTVSGSACMGMLTCHKNRKLNIARSKDASREQRASRKDKSKERSATK